MKVRADAFLVHYLPETATLAVRPLGNLEDAALVGEIPRHRVARIALEVFMVGQGKRSVGRNLCGTFRLASRGRQRIDGAPIQSDTEGSIHGDDIVETPELFLLVRPPTWTAPWDSPPARRMIAV